MPSQRAHFAQHTVPVAAPADVVYGLLADSPAGRSCCPPTFMSNASTSTAPRRACVCGGCGMVRCVPRPSAACCGRQSAVSPSSWTVPTCPAHRRPASGAWHPTAPGRCLVTLRHESPAGPGSTPEALESDVRAELTALCEAAGRWDRLDELLLSFEDSVHVSGSPELVYDFLYRVEDWADLVPHVERADVTEDRPGVQEAVLHTCEPDTGRTLVSECVRLCFPAAGRIVHKETLTPDPVASHYGEWYLEPGETGVRVVSVHHVMLRESAGGVRPGRGRPSRGRPPARTRAAGPVEHGGARPGTVACRAPYADCDERAAPAPYGDGTTTTRRPAMPLTRPAPHAGRPRRAGTAPAPRTNRRRGAVGGAPRRTARRPRDPANPYGRSALWAAGPGTLPVPPPACPVPRTCAAPTSSSAPCARSSAGISPSPTPGASVRC